MFKKILKKALLILRGVPMENRGYLAVNNKEYNMVAIN